MSKQEFVENVKRRSFDAEEAEKRMEAKRREEELKKNPPLPQTG